MKKKKKAPVYSAPALEKGMAILELLANSPGAVPVAEIAAALDRSRAEIYRMLVVLESLGYIHKTDDGRCDLTTRLFDLAIRHTPKRSLVAAARPVMEDLAEKTLQSCHLMINSGDHMVCIAREESPAAIGFAVQVGFRPGLLQSTSGRVYFAFQDAARQELLLRRIKQARHDAAAVQAFVEAAKSIRERGYTQESSLLTAGIEDISAPVYGVDPGLAVASLTIPFVSHRLFSTTIQDALTLLLEAAHQVSERLRNGARNEPRARP